MFWEHKTPGAPATESQSQEEEAFTLLCFPTVFLSSSKQKHTHVTKHNVYFGVRGNAPDNRNFFVVVSFVFLAKSHIAAGIDDSDVHHIFPHCVQL